MGNRRTPAKIDSDRLKIAQLAARGFTIRAIAQQLGLSLSTAHRDLQHVRKGWLEDAAETYGAARAEAIAATNLLLTNLWADYQSNRSVLVVDRILATLDRRSKLYGLTEPDVQRHFHQHVAPAPESPMRDADPVIEADITPEEYITRKMQLLQECLEHEQLSN